MGNSHFSISDISNATTRREFEKRLKSVESTQAQLKDSINGVQQGLQKKTEQLGEDVRPKTLAYLKCIHMGPLRRSLFHASECDKAVSDIANLAMDAIDLSADVETSKELSERIRKVE